MLFTAEPYTDLFDKIFEDMQIDRLTARDIFLYRVKTIKSGDYLECEIFPLWAGKKTKARADKLLETRKAQNNLNNENAQKTIIRLTNHNFTRKDLWFTCTYDNDHLPIDDAAADRNIKNFIRRIKYLLKKRGLPELRYIYVSEGRPETASTGEIVRYHHHMILSGDIDRDELEALWQGGARREAHRLQPDEFGMTGLAKYITKQTKKNRKRWGRSQNLKAPIPTVADTWLTKKKAAKLALDANTAPEIFQKHYKGYKFCDMTVKYSNYISGAYIYTRMQRDPAAKPKKPPKARKSKC